MRNWTKLDGREVASNARKSSLKSGIISVSTTVVSETFNTFKKGKGSPLSKNIKSSLKPNNIKEKKDEWAILKSETSLNLKSDNIYNKF